MDPAREALFVCVDPERDTTAWLREYVRFMPKAFTPVTGTPAPIRTTADAWGVQFAREVTGDPGLRDVAHGRRLPGRCRRDAARDFPVRDLVRGDDRGPPARRLGARRDDRQQPPHPADAHRAADAVTPAEARRRPPRSASIPLAVHVISSSVWSGRAAGHPAPLRAGARIDDPTARPSAQLIDRWRPDRRCGRGVAVQPPGVAPSPTWPP